MPDRPPTLSDMIKQQTDKNVTLAELEKRSADPTTGKPRISDSQLSRIATGTITRIPTEEQLRGFAAAVGISYDLVRRAAIDQWLPADNADLTEDDERERLRNEALRLRAIADEALRRIDEKSGEPPAHPQSA